MEKYYYYRDEKRRPMVTVCVKQNETGEKGIGVAICSEKDVPAKAIGKAIALGRATKALRLKQSNSPVQRIRASQMVAKCNAMSMYEHFYKSSYEKCV